MTKDELKALGLTDEQADKVVKDYKDNYVAKADYDTQKLNLLSIDDLIALKENFMNLKHTIKVGTFLFLRFQTS